MQTIISKYQLWNIDGLAKLLSNHAFPVFIIVIYSISVPAQMDLRFSPHPPVHNTLKLRENIIGVENKTTSTF